jgi:hypothetical protein
MRRVPRILAAAWLSATLAAAASARAADPDGDGVASEGDNCPTVANPNQVDVDGDGIGNLCDTCLKVADPAQEDEDEDGVGDACDACPGTTADVPVSGPYRLGEDERIAVDGAGCSVEQRCPCTGPAGDPLPWDSHRQYVTCASRAARVLHRARVLTGAERRGLARVVARSECGRFFPEPGDADGDGVPEDGDETRINGDGRCASGVLVRCDDNCARVPNPRQKDSDGDRVGNACDRCPGTPTGVTTDAAGCSKAQRNPPPTTTTTTQPGTPALPALASDGTP